MKLFWIIGRTALSLFICFLVNQVGFDGHRSLILDKSITSANDFWLNTGLIVLGVFGLYKLEIAYAKKFKLTDGLGFYQFELFLMVVFVICSTFLVLSDFWQIQKQKHDVWVMMYYFALFSFVPIMLSMIDRKKIPVPSKEKEKDVEWEQRILSKIDEVNRQFDNKSGSVKTSIDYRNWGIGKNTGQWDLMYGIQSKLKVVISRPISSMKSREREIFRIFKLLDIGNLNDFLRAHLLPPLIWADGKGIVEGGWSFNIYKKPKAQGESLTDLASSINEAVDVFIKNACRYNNFEAAVAKVFDICNIRFEDSESHPVIKEIKRRLISGNAWLDSDEIESTGMFARSQPEQGGVFLGKMKDGRNCWFTGEGSVISIAPPGSGKTQTHIIPNLLSWKGPAVVLDVKGELWDKTAGLRSVIGPVYRFAPLDPDNSHCYNPLTFVRDDPDYIWGDAKFLASMIAHKTEAKDPFWENKARDVITAAIAVECMKHLPEDRQMSNVVGYCYGRDWIELIARLDDAPVNAMKNMAANFLRLEKKQQSNSSMEGVFQQAQMFMSPWEGNRIEKATIRSDWSPLDLRTGSPTIYIGLKAGEIDTYSGLLRLFIAQHMRMLFQQEVPPKDTQDILFMLDEFPRLKYMPEIEETLEIGRQYKVKMFLAVQSIGQVKQHYKNADGLIGSCAVRAFMNPSTFDGSANKLSEDLGFFESIVDGSKHKIAEPTDLAGGEYLNDVIILTTGTKPIRASKAFAFKEPTIAERMNIPIPRIQKSDRNLEASQT